MRLPALLSLAFLTACLPTPSAEVSMNRAGTGDTRITVTPATMSGFGFGAGHLAAHSNASLVQDILDLTFQMESGRPLPVLSRFEGPVTARLIGDVPASASADFDRLLARLRGEAGIDIRETGGSDASITVQFLPRAQIRSVYANVACFVVPGVSDWTEFKAMKNTARTDWTQITRRTRAAIFVPSDSSAQEARDCLHEETAQALGPLNDLYRLSDSVFNDDNFQTVLTGFDMLVLRALYAPDLASGMSEGDVAARLPAILARLNPGGEGRGGTGASPTPRQWQNQVEIALSGGNRGLPAREEAAQQAIAIARAQGWNDGRLALSYFALGRLTLSRRPDIALPALAEAARIWQGLPGGSVQAAHVEMQMAAHALSSGRPEECLDRVARALPVARGAENAALAATLMMLQAEALDAAGREDEAARVRAETRGWASYGFGSESQIRARASEIAVLARRAQRS
jgi:hypothetical protein